MQTLTWPNDSYSINAALKSSERPEDGPIGQKPYQYIQSICQTDEPQQVRSRCLHVALTGSWSIEQSDHP